MTRSDHDDDRFDAFLRAHAPPDLADDGFVTRTMGAVEQASRGVALARRPTPAAPLAIARALAAEQRRHAAQARLWRWAIAGVAAGGLMMVVAVLLSPAQGPISASPPQWFPLSALLAVAAVWIAWRELRSS